MRRGCVMAETQYGEPLRVEEIGDVDGDPRIDLDARAGVDYTILDANGDEITTISDRKRAYRFVACVNALAGMDPGALEDFIREAKQLRWVCGDGSAPIMPGTDNLRGFDRALRALERTDA